MKKLLLLILILPVLFNVNAQDHFLGVKGDVSWRNVSSGDMFENSKSLKKLSGGVTYEYFINDIVSIGSGLAYEQRGFTEEFILVSGETFHSTYSFNYLSLPVEIGSYSRNNDFFGKSRIGAVISYKFYGGGSKI